MTIGVVGRKTGMTRVFTEEGVSVPVTVLQVEPNRVSQVKTVETDGYQAIQVTVGERRAQHRVSQPVKGHLAKAEMRMGRGLWEFRVDDLGELAVGSEISVNQFEAGQIVDVTGQSKGKGFAGAVKRWNFRTQDATHGNSLSHRAPGSIGNCQTPGRVFKGKKWPATWVMSALLFKVLKWSESTEIKALSWLRVLFQARTEPTSSSSPQRRPEGVEHGIESNSRWNS